MDEKDTQTLRQTVWVSLSYPRHGVRKENIHSGTMRCDVFERYAKTLGKHTPSGYGLPLLLVGSGVWMDNLLLKMEIKKLKNGRVVMGDASFSGGENLFLHPMKAGVILISNSTNPHDFNCYHLQVNQVKATVIEGVSTPFDGTAKELKGILEESFFFLAKKNSGQVLEGSQITEL